MKPYPVDSLKGVLIVWIQNFIAYKITIFWVNIDDTREENGHWCARSFMYINSTKN